MRQRLFILAALLSLWFVAVPRAASTYTVKTSGGNYATPQACANVAAGDDICEVYSGTYPGWTQGTNGTSGHPITFQAHAGDTVVLNTLITLDSRSYITIGGAAANQGFEITVEGVHLSANNTIIIQNNNIHDTTSTRCINHTVPAATESTFIWIRNNTLNQCGTDGDGIQQGIYALGGGHWLIEGNTIKHVEDGIVIFGDRDVMRNNHCGPVDAGEYGSQHPDCLETPGSDEDPVTHLLWEGNTVGDWADADGHVFLLRDPNDLGMDQNIIRYNTDYTIGSFWAATDDHNRRLYIYNNSVNGDGTTDRSDLTACSSSCNGTKPDTGWQVINNAFKDMPGTTGGNPAGICHEAASTPFVEHHNLFFLTGYSSTWSGPNGCASSDADAYAASDIKNTNPNFTSTSNLTPQVGSVLIGAGGALTTASGLGSSSTSLTTATDGAGFFQDGFGYPAAWGVLADWICVGTVSNCAQISAINYSTNVITLVSALTWANGDSIWLYKKSDGVRVLTASAPNIGAAQPALSTSPRVPFIRR